MTELTHPVELCDPRRPGRLNAAAVGWSRRPLHRCNLSRAWLRKKRWNYWAFTTPTHLFSVTVSSLDFAGLAFVYLADFETGKVEEATVLTPFGRGCVLPERVFEDASFASPGLRVEMTQRGGLDGPRSTSFRVECDDFAGRPLRAELEARYPAEHETLNVVVPWDDRHFQFTAKHNALPVEGEVILGGGGQGGVTTRVDFSGPQCFGCLDYGRGVWPRKCKWNWGAASGQQQDHTIGLNLGGQWTDGTGATENALCIDGRLSKIDEELAWEYDTLDRMRPWYMHTPEHDAVDLRFSPMAERVAATNNLIIRSEVHQMFGTYDGSVRDADGQTLEIDGLIGWAEDHVALW